MKNDSILTTHNIYRFIIIKIILPSILVSLVSTLSLSFLNSEASEQIFSTQNLALSLFIFLSIGFVLSIDIIVKFHNENLKKN